MVECVQILTTLVIPEAVKKELNGNIPKEVCTTGNSKTDMYIWNNDRLKLVQKLFSGWDHYNGWDYLGYTPDGYYQFDYATKQEPENTNQYFMSDAKGNITRFAYVNYILGTAPRKFMAYNRFDSINLEVGKGGDQQGTFTFEGATKDCIKISWDPYGRVFDSQTLEPIPEASVTLMKKNEQKSYVLMSSTDVPGGYIDNPQLVKETGQFNFIVPDGTYQLNVAAPGFKFPYNFSSIHPNNKKIYSDLYRGEDIVQKGKMIHRDIPMDPVVKQPVGKNPAKILGLFQTAEISGNTIIDGNVTHPFALIKAYCKKVTGGKGTLNTTAQADKMGDFKLTFDHYKCDKEQGEMYGVIDVESVDLTQTNFDRLLSRIKKLFLMDVLADSVTSYSLDPIPTYIEGYAKDNNGKIMPNARVGVFGIGDTRPYRTVMSDGNGYFRIASDNLLSSPYQLRYLPTNGKVVTVSTTKFITQNLAVIKNNKINLFSYIPAKVVVAAEKTVLKPTSSVLYKSTTNNKVNALTKGTNSINNRNGLQTKPLNKNVVKNQTTNHLAIIIVIIFILILAVGVLIWLHLKNKKFE